MGGRGGRAVQAPGLARTKLWLIAGTLELFSRQGKWCLCWGVVQRGQKGLVAPGFVYHEEESV